MTETAAVVSFLLHQEYYISMNNHTAKHFVLQLGSLISLYLSVAFFIVLTFGLINLLFPDTLDGVWQIEQAASSIRLGFAMVVVFFPTYLVLTRMVNSNRRASDDSHYLGLTKWLIYLSLLVAGLVLLGDLVAVIMGLLEGELTSRFLLKALTVFVVTGAAFYYYIQDAKGYWLTRARGSLIYGAVAAMLIAGVLVSALMYIPSPTTVREMRADTELVYALQDVQWRVQDFYLENDRLPETLGDAYGEFDRLPDTAELADYTYTVESETAYNLCTTFNHDSNELDNQYRPMPSMAMEDAMYWKNNDWDYRAGEWCFERKVVAEEIIK